MTFLDASTAFLNGGGRCNCTGFCVWGLRIFWQTWHPAELCFPPHPQSHSLYCRRSFASPPRPPFWLPCIPEKPVCLPQVHWVPWQGWSGASIQGLLTCAVWQVPWFCREIPPALERWATRKTNAQVSLCSTEKGFALRHSKVCFPPKEFQVRLSSSPAFSSLAYSFLSWVWQKN